MHKPLWEDVELARGDMFRLPLQFIDGDKNAIPLAGSDVIRLTVKERWSDSNPISDSSAGFQITLAGGGITITDPVNGKAVAVAPKSTTGLLQVKSYVYDVELEKSGWPGPLTTRRGNFNVTPDASI